MAHYKDDFSFGSKAFQEFHHGKNKDGARSKGDRAHRARDGYKKAETKKAQAEAAETQRAGIETQNAIHEKETRLMEALIKGGSYAVKIAPPNGFITPTDVESFRANGWQVFPAGTAPAKVGGKLGAVEPWDVHMNPAPDQAPDQAHDLQAILGPELKARAVVVASPKPMSLENLWDWRRAGYEISLAPLSYRRGVKRARTNPTKDTQKAIYEALKKAGEPQSVEDLADRIHADPGWILAGLQRLESMGLAHPSRESLFGSLWSPGTKERGLFVNPEKEKSKNQTLSGHNRTHQDTRKIKTAYAGEMAKKPTPKKPHESRPKHREKKLLTLNPDSLAEVWEMWTGESHPTLTVDMSVDDRGDMPERVVMLGRLTELLGKDEQRLFGKSGPLMVTDESMKRCWFVSKKPMKFAINMSKCVIGYLACKPKFGDKAPVKYLHLFSGKVQAAMAGNVGELTGKYKITPNGIEG